MSDSQIELSCRLGHRVLSCPAQGKWTSFQLIDEKGSGKPYAGLIYEATDTEGQKYNGKLDGAGNGKVENHFAGPIALTFNQEYKGAELVYVRQREREFYPLKITELQVRAERTRFQNSNGSRTDSNPAQAQADAFYQVEVRQLVKHTSHLPPAVECNFPVGLGASRLMRQHGKLGVCLAPTRHNVLEIRPLRALRPMLSTDSEFCVLNLYQLSLMATLSYCPFGQEPAEQPVRSNKVSFGSSPSSGNWFGDALAKFAEIWKVDSGQTSPYHPLYEDVAYSKRFEIVPFDPELYPENSPELAAGQENPGNIHFLDDRGSDTDTDSQAFITHNDELILIAVRGTSEMIPDLLRDADALQIAFEEGDGNVHRGFYEAAKSVHSFVLRYLTKFYAGQKIVICGHSLGGAASLLLAEMLRRDPQHPYDIMLYTYGAPRAADATFVKNAADLVHYRMVNHNDLIPSVPATWMDTNPRVYVPGAMMSFFNVPVGISVFAAGIINWTGEPYQHHGKLYHFMPVEFSAEQTSSILWEPGCDTITQHPACVVATQQVDGLPLRPGIVTQAININNHFMFDGYVPKCWAALRRWQEALEFKRSLVTNREFYMLDGSLELITQQIRERRRQMQYNTPTPYTRAQELAIIGLSHEIDLIRITRDRLTTLRWMTIGAKHVYGSLAEQPIMLAENLARWNAHRENRVAEQLAMAPEEKCGLVTMVSRRNNGGPYV